VGVCRVFLLFLSELLRHLVSERGELVEEVLGLKETLRVTKKIDSLPRSITKLPEATNVRCYLTQGCYGIGFLNRNLL